MSWISGKIRGIPVVLWIGAICGLIVVAALMRGTNSAPQTGEKGASANAQAGGTVVARGRIEPQSRVRVLHGHDRSVLQSVLVHEGDEVRQGTALAELNSLPLLNAKLELEERRLDEMQVMADQVRAPAKAASLAAQRAIIQQRQAELGRLEQEFERASYLRANQYLSTANFDSRRAEMEAARHALSEARATLSAMSETRNVDMVVADARIATQQAAVQQARAERDRAIIRAPIDGRILFIFARSGELLADDGLLQMADMSKLIAVAEVNENDMRRVSVGQSAIIRSPLIPDPIEGKLTRSSETIFKQKRPTSDILIGRDARIAEIEIEPMAPLPNLIGAELTIEIVTR